jgi:hypothetical protein
MRAATVLLAGRRGQGQARSGQGEEAGDERQPAAHAVEGAPRQRPGEDDRDGRGDEGDAGGRRAHADHEQEVERQQEAEAELDGAGQQLTEVGREEVQVPEEAELEQRRRDPGLDHNERSEQRYGPRERDDGLGRSPAVVLTLAQPVHQGGDGQPERDRTRIVDARPAVATRTKRGSRREGEEDGDDGERHVDQEHESPVDAGQEAAEHRSERREEGRCSGQDAQRRARRSSE